MKTGENGFAIPALLYLALLLSAFCLATFSLARKAEKVAITREHAQSAHNRGAFALLQDLSTSDGTNLARGLNCQSRHGDAALTTVQHSFCFVYNPADYTLLPRKIIDAKFLGAGEAFPSFDYNKIFREPAGCSLTQHAEALQSEFGFHLSAGAQLAKQTCREAPAQIQNLALLSNLALEHPIQVSGILAAVGYMDLRGKVRINDPSIIIAGGDLYIESLESSLPAGAPLTLISTSGVVQIKEISPTIQLKVITWAGAYLGGPSGAQQSPLLPPLLTVHPLGFIK